MADRLKSALRSAGADLVGYADLERLDPAARDNLPFGVSIAVALDPRIVFEIMNGPTAAYWAEYMRANALLSDLANMATDFLRKQGHTAKPLLPTLASLDTTAGSSAGYDTATLSTALPHKTAATLAGLGWIGRCALLVTREFGSALRLTTVLTDAALQPGKPVERSRCGTCSRCVDACPAQAVSGNLWESGCRRDSLLDAAACRSKAHQLTLDRIGVNETICGICIASCRRTAKYLRRAGLPRYGGQ